MVQFADVVDDKIKELADVVERRVANYIVRDIKNMYKRAFLDHSRQNVGQCVAHNIQQKKSKCFLDSTQIYQYFTKKRDAKLDAHIRLMKNRYFRFRFFKKYKYKCQQTHFLNK
jgi:hypothetical protein